MNLSPRTQLIIAYERLAEDAKKYVGLDQRWAVRHDLLEDLRDAILAMPPDLDNPYQAQGTTIVIETEYEFDPEEEGAVVAALASAWPEGDKQPTISVFVPAKEGT